MVVSNIKYRFFPKVRRVYSTSLSFNEFDEVCSKHKFDESASKFFCNRIIVYSEDEQTCISHQYEDEGHDSVIIVEHKQQDIDFRIEAVYVKPAKIMLFITAFFAFALAITLSSSNDLEDKLETSLCVVGFCIFFYLFSILIHFNTIYNLENFLEEKFDCKRIRT